MQPEEEEQEEQEEEEQQPQQEEDAVTKAAMPRAKTSDLRQVKSARTSFLAHFWKLLF